MLDEKGKNFSFFYTYLNSNEISLAENHTYSELKKILNPDYINLHNWIWHRDVYKRVYETEIVLKEKTVSAQILENAKYDTIQVEFVYDNILIEMSLPTDSFNAEWFNELCFSKVTPEQSNP